MSPRNKAIQKSAQQLANEIYAAKALKETLLKLTDDASAIADTIEGETSLHDAIANVMEFVRDDEIMVAGIERMQETLSARKSRLETRIDFYRNAMLQAMQIGEIKTIELPDATITASRTARGLEIVNESEIPALYWKPQDPTLDKKALKDALKDGQDIPGALLNNGGISITIRRA